jgi:hypothetical protein
VILLNRDWWLHPRTTEAQRDAVLDHECCHMAITFDKETGEPLYDDRGRNVFRIRKHSIEEFTEIVDRHGIYKRDVEAFASAVARAERSTGGEWIGYTKLRDTLRSIGVTLDVAVIATWSDDERREVMTWALLRQDDTVGKKADVISLSQTVPECLAAALGRRNIAWNRRPPTPRTEDAMTRTIEWTGGASMPPCTLTALPGARRRGQRPLRRPRAGPTPPPRQRRRRQRAALRPLPAAVIRDGEWYRRVDGVGAATPRCQQPKE